MRNIQVGFMTFFTVLLMVGVSAAAKAGAMGSSGNFSSSNSTNNSTSGNNCGGTPQPYTGGAGVAKVFYPPDGSTVTITKTGAVIKQSPCGNPYREGWVNTNNMGNINSSQDINGQLRAGATNPYNNSQTSSGNSASSNTTSNAQANAKVYGATTYAPTSTASRPTQTGANAPTYTSGKTPYLPNTGGGNVFAIAAVATMLGTIGHFLYRNFRHRLPV